MKKASSLHKSMRLLAGSPSTRLVRHLCLLLAGPVTQLGAQTQRAVKEEKPSESIEVCIESFQRPADIDPVSSPSGRIFTVFSDAELGSRPKAKKLIPEVRYPHRKFDIRKLMWWHSFLP